jgi:hypothetical protein
VCGAETCSIARRLLPGALGGAAGGGANRASREVGRREREVKVGARRVAAWIAVLLAGAGAAALWWRIIPGLSILEKRYA